MSFEVSDVTRRSWWPFSAAATFVGLMWVAYFWATFVTREGTHDLVGALMTGLSPLADDAAGALQTQRVLQGHEWERVVSGLFLHAGLLHILFNSSAILQLGRFLEAFSTRGRAWLAMLVAGLTSSFTIMAWESIRGQYRGAIGASGVACGLGAALVVMNWGIKSGPLAEFRKQIFAWLVVALLMGFIPRISGAGHAGGMIGGAAVGFVLRKRGSVVLGRDSLSAALRYATIALTIAYVAALGMTAWKAPARHRRNVDAVAVYYAMADVQRWLKEEPPPAEDVRVWIDRVASFDLESPYVEWRDKLVGLVRAMKLAEGHVLTPEERKVALERLSTDGG